MDGLDKEVGSQNSSPDHGTTRSRLDEDLVVLETQRAELIDNSI